MSPFFKRSAFSQVQGSGPAPVFTQCYLDTEYKIPNFTVMINVLCTYLPVRFMENIISDQQSINLVYVGITTKKKQLKRCGRFKL